MVYCKLFPQTALSLLSQLRILKLVWLSNHKIPSVFKYTIHDQALYMYSNIIWQCSGFVIPSCKHALFTPVIHSEAMRQSLPLTFQNNRTDSGITIFLSPIMCMQVCMSTCIACIPCFCSLSIIINIITGMQCLSKIMLLLLILCQQTMNYVNNYPHLVPPMMVIIMAVAQDEQVLEEAKSCFPCIHCTTPSTGWEVIWPIAPRWTLYIYMHPNLFE